MTAAKAWLSLLGGLLTVAIPLIVQVSTALPPPWPAVIGGVVAILTALGVYHVPNKPVEPQVVTDTAPPAVPPPGGWLNPWKIR